MFEAEYLQECERAELLGLPKPDKEGFVARRSGQMALARQIEEIRSEIQARPESKEIRITIHEVSDNRPLSQDENVRKIMMFMNFFKKTEDDLVHINKISSEIKSMMDKLQAKKRAKNQAKAEASNLQAEQVEGDDAAMKTDPQAEPSTSAVPGTSTEGAQKDEQSHPSRWNTFIQLWRNFVYPKKANK